MKHKVFWAWFALVLYCSLIFYLSSQSEWIPPLRKLHSFDKVLHFVEYGVLGILWGLARWGSHFRNRWGWLMGVFFILLFGASDEWHQSFVIGREMSLGDWFSDAVGGSVGFFVLSFFSKSPPS